MTDTITINDTEYDLGNSGACAAAAEDVTAHIEKLEKKKREIEDKLSLSFFDFKDAKKLRKAKAETEEELDHFRMLLEQLEDKSREVLEQEMAAKTKDEIARLERQSAALSELCEKEIPAACRKLAVIAAALEKHQKESAHGRHMAESHDIAFPAMPDPVQRIAGKQAFASDWIKHLRLPYLDEQPDIVTFWPLPDVHQYPDCHQDNPGILNEVDALLKADDLLKAAKTLFGKIEKHKIKIRKVENEEHIMQDYSKPHWYERPRTEWADLLGPNSISASLRQLGDPVKFWLDLPHQRRFGAFLHLLGPEERERALAQIPEEERAQYRDHLAAFDSKVTFAKEPEPLEAAG